MSVNALCILRDWLALNGASTYAYATIHPIFVLRPKTEGRSCPISTTIEDFAGIFNMRNGTWVLFKAHDDGGGCTHVYVRTATTIPIPKLVDGVALQGVGKKHDGLAHYG